MTDYKQLTPGTLESTGVKSGSSTSSKDGAPAEKVSAGELPSAELAGAERHEVDVVDLTGDTSESEDEDEDNNIMPEGTPPTPKARVPSVISEHETRAPDQNDLLRRLRFRSRFLSKVSKVKSKRYNKYSRHILQQQIRIEKLSEELARAKEDIKRLELETEALNNYILSTAGQVKDHDKRDG